MGIFKSIFGNNEKNEQSKVAWNYLESMEDLDAAEALSKEKIIVIFKHSTRCSISRFVLKQFENIYVSNQNRELYFLNLIEYRPISNEIASRFGVLHQSPQLIVLKDGKAIFNASHENIDAQHLEKFI